MKMCFIYIIGQVIGAFISAPVVYLVYYDAIHAIDPELSIPGDYYQNKKIKYSPRFRLPT